MNAATYPTRRPLAIVVIVAIAIRLLIIAIGYVSIGDETAFHENDSRGYLTLAQSLANSASFQREGKPEIRRTPGYPLFLAATIRTSRPSLAAVILQTALAAASVALTYHLAQSWFPDAPRAFPTVAAAWLALEPLSAVYTAKILAETLFTLLVLAFLWQLTKALRADNASSMLLAMLLLALATFVRPVTYWLAPLLAMAFLIPVIPRPPRPRRITVVAALTIAMLPLFAWQARNVARADYAGFSSIFDVDLYFCHKAAIELDRLGEAERPTYDEFQHQLGFVDEDVYLAQHPDQKDWTEAQRCRYLRAEGLEALRQHPLRYARIHLHGIFQVLFDNGTSAVDDYFHLTPAEETDAVAPAPNSAWSRFLTALGDKPAYVAAWLLLEASTLALIFTAALGVLLALRANPVNTLLVLGIVAYVVLLSGGPVGSHRMRIPLVPVFCIYAAYAGTTVAAWYHARRSTPTTSAP